MSKSAKNASKEKRKKDKRARKAAMQAQFATWTSAGHNSKSKRHVLNNKRLDRGRVVRHSVLYCGNPGCQRCFPELNLQCYVPTTKKVVIISHRKSDGRTKIKLFDLE